MNNPDSLKEFIEEIKSKFKNKNTKQFQVFNLLSDLQWHCRSCEGKAIVTAQYAGGGGIQGLEKGNKTRPGLVIETKKDNCPNCGKKTQWDRWTGEIKESSVAANIPKTLAKRILEFYSYTDVIEQRKRSDDELIIDHRFPMLRWGESEEKHNVNMNEEEIRKKFQLLKKDSSGNHNLLKSRACEKCKETGKRGSPFGIKFWYKGEENWSCSKEIGSEAEEGCIGCGWYDFEAWRQALNEKISK